MIHVPGFFGVQTLPAAVTQRISPFFRFYDSLQYQGVDGLTPPLASVEEIASYLIPQIREVSPQGPYRLSGYSFGGLVAFEIARQLQAQGSKIDLVLIIDTLLPESLRKLSVEEAIEALNQRLSGLSFGSRVAFLLKRAFIKLCWFLFPRKFNDFLFWRPPTEQPLVRSSAEKPPPAQQSTDAISKRMIEAASQALSRYKPLPAEINTVIFQAEFQKYSKGLRYQTNGLYGWDSLSSKVKIRTVACEHTGFFLEPAVSILAEHILSVLQEINAEVSTQNKIERAKQTHG